MDHDQRFKTLLKEFLEDFFRLFFPEWAERFDFSEVEWLEQEFFADPPEGTRGVLDLVAKLKERRPSSGQQRETPGTWLSLIHIEIESRDSAAAFRRRFHWYYTNLRHRHELPVLPVALYLRVGLDGIGTDQYTEDYGPLEILRFSFLYVGLPRLDSLEYLEKGNDLGLALTALMNIPRDRRAWLKAESIRRVGQSEENEFRKFLLAECIQTYLALDDPAEQDEFQRLLDSEQYREVKRMATTWFEEGIEQGLVEFREALVDQLQERFGSVSEPVRQRIEQFSRDELRELARRLIKVESLEELHLE